MATPKKPTTARRAPRSRAASATTKTKSTAAKTTTVKPSAAKPSTAKPSAAARAGKAISDRPVASAAIVTGLVSGIAAAVAGFFAFKKSGKTFSEFSGDIATSVKETASETSERVKDGLADAGTKAKDRVSKIRDGIDERFAADKTPADGKTQAEIAEEALTLKQTGTTTKIPTDPTVADQTNGAGLRADFAERRTRYGIRSMT